MSRLALLAMICAALPSSGRSQTAEAPIPAQDISLPMLLSRYQAEPRSALLCEQIGVAYTRLNDLNNAAEFFRKAVALNPERISAQKNLATVLWFLNRREESAGVFESLEKRAPTDPVAQLYLGLRDYDGKQMDTAAGHFERAGALASDNPETLPIVIEAYIATGRSEGAIRLIERRIAFGKSDPQTFRWLGDAYDSQMQPEKAFRAYSEAIRLQPAGEDNYLALAAFALAHANPSFARGVLADGLRQEPHSATLLLELGLAWALQGDFEKARQYFGDANAARPDWSVPLIALGVTDLQTGNADRAADCFRKAKTVSPEDYRSYYLHAVALIRSHTNQNASARAEAMSELRRAIALEPRHANVRVALAETEIADGQLSAAEVELREALRLEPTESTALYKLALLCRRKGMTEEAKHLLQAFEQSKNKSRSEENEFVLILKTVK
jgi:tetratricopeptide (TPR) repeat protein